MFEDMKALRKVRSKALSLIHTGKWKIINADNPKDLINLEIQKQIHQKRNLKMFDKNACLCYYQFLRNNFFSYKLLHTCQF